MTETKNYQLMELKHFRLERREVDPTGIVDFVVHLKDDPRNVDIGKIILVGNRWEFHGWIGCNMNSGLLHELWEIVHLLDVWPDAFNPVLERSK